jgi:hypothetical protein
MHADPGTMREWQEMQKTFQPPEDFRMKVGFAEMMLRMLCSATYPPPLSTTPPRPSSPLTPLLSHLDQCLPTPVHSQLATRTAPKHSYCACCACFGPAGR